MVTAPKPPASIASISPPGAVFKRAPAKVLHGAGRSQGLTSSPLLAETHVRGIWALAADVKPRHKPTTAVVRANEFLITLISPESDYTGSAVIIAGPGI